MVVLSAPSLAHAECAGGDSTAHGARHAAPRALPDTLLSYTMPEVVVTATRSWISLNHAPSPVTVIERSQFDNSGRPGVWGAIAGSPGVFLRDLGGGSGLKTVSVRGTASNQTVVLMDGVPLNSWQNGSMDLWLLTADAFQRVEIARGGQSALYGADAMAGAVNLITRQPSDSLSLSFGYSVGSAGTEGLRAVGSGSAGFVAVMGGGSFEESRGNFAYHRQVGQSSELLERQFAGYRQGNAFLKVSSRLPDGAQVSLFTLLDYGDRGSPGADFGGTPLDARLRDVGVQSLLKSSLPLGRGELRVVLHHHHNIQEYEEKSGPFPAATTYTNDRIGASAQWHVAIGNQTGLVTGVDVTRGRLASTALSDKAQRTALGIFAAGELYWGGSTSSRVVLYPMLRWDSYSDISSYWSPKLGLNVWLTKGGDIQLRGSAGLSYRAPSFNELYWKDGGNPSLRHEQAFSGELGLVLRLDGFGHHRVDLSWFAMRMRDRITGWPPVNLSRAELYGGELAWEWRPGSQLPSIRAAAAVTRAYSPDGSFAGNQLPYVPLVQGSVSVERRISFVEIFVQTRFASRQFTTLDNTTPLSSSPYAVVDCSIASYVPLLGIDSRLQLLVENLLDNDYEIVRGYPMPLRSYRVNLSLQLP